MQDATTLWPSFRAGGVGKNQAKERMPRLWMVFMVNHWCGTGELCYSQWLFGLHVSPA